MFEGLIHRASIQPDALFDALQTENFYLHLSASLVITRPVPMNVQNKALISTDEAEVLCQFEMYPSLELLSRKMGRDLTVLSKILKRISEKTDALIKVGGRWKLTESGHSLNQATRDYLHSQHSIVNGKYLLRIGTNREFSARVIAPHIKLFQNSFPNREISISVFESGTEAALLEGRIDLGFDCGRPRSPDIFHKSLVDEEVLPVASPSFHLKYRSSFQKRDFSAAPHLLYERMPPDKYMGEMGRQVTVLLQSNDIASIRTMCLEGVGWALLPKYSVQKELDEGLLKPCQAQRYESDRYGVWRLRSRKHLAADFTSACKWLSSIKLA
jgi:DNA-binding transcriptional LysR family regulator